MTPILIDLNDWGRNEDLTLAGEASSRFETIPMKRSDKP